MHISLLQWDVFENVFGEVFLFVCFLIFEIVVFSKPFLYFHTHNLYIFWTYNCVLIDNHNLFTMYILNYHFAYIQKLNGLVPLPLSPFYSVVNFMWSVSYIYTYISSRSGLRCSQTNLCMPNPLAWLHCRIFAVVNVTI